MGGLRVLTAAQGLRVAPARAEMSPQPRSGTARWKQEEGLCHLVVTWPMSGFVSQWSPGVVGTWWVPGPSCSCRTIQCPQQLGCVSVLRWGNATTCECHLPTEVPGRAAWMSLQGCGKSQCDPSVKYVVSSISDSQGAPRDRVSETTLFSPPLPLVPRLSWHFCQGLVGWSPTTPSILLSPCPPGHPEEL